MDTLTIFLDTCRVLTEHHALAIKSFSNCDSLANSCCECVPVAANSCCNCTSSCDDATCITLIICGTIFLLGLMSSILLYLLKKKQLKSRIKAKEKELEYAIESNKTELAIKKEEEKKHYRSMLANFLELRAKGSSVTEKDQKFHFDKELCDKYIDELKSLITDLTPKQDPPKS